MKKFLGLVIVILVILFSTSTMAAVRNFQVTWNPNTDDTTQYVLWVNNIAIATLEGIGTTTWTGAVTIVEGSNTFEVTAKDAVGNESLRSDPSFFVLDTMAPSKVKNLKVILLP